MERNTNPQEPIYFTNEEFATIVKETEREFAPKSVENIDKKTITPEQKKELLNMDIQQSHRLAIFRYMNVENGLEIVSEDIKMKHKSKSEINQSEKQINKGPNQNLTKATQSIAQNVKQAAKGLNID